ncbi:hypothetical protein K493DRAFT_317857 [Basidiobolus meristosporus CBS 931.73]|uniref:Uncharacterized protein n=1 Tax=Basidiobolus meristosporus CBS 931.73 TaxID=1314790 RepID=A0A1Y1XXY8_9FUNG|nr:hypothetical protein K493DRAFT_317857 [Basidiobolus meristosporus CBS 931.73]|eukprot:ORX90612.1 hypothetical protein K493DRAFT_317857 [Basidiobolus meristosporus CBS 931.73]
MLKYILFTILTVSSFSCGLPVGRASPHQGSNSLSVQDEPTYRVIPMSIEEIDALTALQLAEDDALYTNQLMDAEDDEDYDHTYINDYNTYLAMVEDPST